MATNVLFGYAACLLTFGAFLAGLGTYAYEVFFVRSLEQTGVVMFTNLSLLLVHHDDLVLARWHVH